MGTTLKRIIAICLDVELIKIVFTLVIKSLYLLVKSEVICLITLLVLGIYVYINLDCLIGYESIGKKIMRLQIYVNDEKLTDKTILRKRALYTYLTLIFSGPKLILTGKTDADTKYNTEVK